jgi:hypothetical protein
MSLSVYFWIGSWKTNDSAPNDSKHSRARRSSALKIVRHKGRLDLPHLTLIVAAEYHRRLGLLDT